MADVVSVPAFPPVVGSADPFDMAVDAIVSSSPQAEMAYSMALMLQGEFTYRLAAAMVRKAEREQRSLSALAAELDGLAPSGSDPEWRCTLLGAVAHWLSDTPMTGAPNLPIKPPGF